MWRFTSEGLLTRELFPKVAIFRVVIGRPAIFQDDYFSDGHLSAAIDLVLLLKITYFSSFTYSNISS